MGYVWLREDLLITKAKQITRRVMVSPCGFHWSFLTWPFFFLGSIAIGIICGKDISNMKVREKETPSGLFWRKVLALLFNRLKWLEDYGYGLKWRPNYPTNNFSYYLFLSNQSLSFYRNSSPMGLPQTILGLFLLSFNFWERGNIYYLGDNKLRILPPSGWFFSVSYDSSRLLFQQIVYFFEPKAMLYIHYWLPHNSWVE